MDSGGALKVIAVVTLIRLSFFVSHLFYRMIRGSSLPQNHISDRLNEFAALLSEVELTHRTIDTHTQRLRQLIGPNADATRRAEEAGAALHRLEWALERLEASFSSELHATNGSGR